MAVEHASLSGADVHEPKGIASATSGDVYRATGAVTGEWKKSFSYGEMDIVGYATATTFASSSTYKQLATGWATGLVSGLTFSTDTLTVVTPGIYRVSVNGNAVGAITTATSYSIDFAKNGTANGKPCTMHFKSSEKYPFGLDTLVSLSASDTLTFVIKNNADTNSITVSDCKFVATLVKAS
jgi:hypothetical protein